MPKETGETLCETQGNVKGNGGKHEGNFHEVRGFLGHLVTSFQVASYIDRCRGIFNIFPAHFSFWSDQKSQHEARLQRHWMYMCVYLDLFCDIPEILRYTWVYSKGNFQRIKAKQVFIVFNWKEDTSVEEEEGKLRKVIANRFGAIALSYPPFFYWWFWCRISCWLRII